MCLRNSGLRKTWLDKSLKSPVSDNRFTGNLVNGPKHCFNVNHRTVPILIDHCGGN